eukprot:5952983-Prymnesium_polylepis.1
MELRSHPCTLDGTRFIIPRNDERHRQGQRQRDITTSGQWTAPVPRTRLIVIRNRSVSRENRRTRKANDFAPHKCVSTVSRSLGGMRSRN